MEETKTENGNGVESRELAHQPPNGVREMEFSYSRSGAVGVYTTGGSNPDPRLLETQTSARSFEYSLPTSFTSGSYGDVPVLVSRSSVSRGSKAPLVCLVEGCQRDLSTEKKYYKRYGMCMEHLKMNAIIVDGKQQRFCQQCGRFQELSEFDGEKRNCRERLNQHNLRRRKPKRGAGGSDGSWDDWSHDQRSGKALKGRRSQRLMEKTGPSPLWSSDLAHPYTQMMSSPEGHKNGGGLTSEGMEMIEGVPLSRLRDEITVPPYNQFADELGLTQGRQGEENTNQGRESLYNMVVHQILPPGSAPTSTATGQDYNHLETPHAEAPGNLTTLLQASELPTPVNGLQQGSSFIEDLPTTFPLLAGMGMLQSVCVSTAGGTPRVPMLVFPSTSGATQVNALAIIPTSITSGQTLMPIPWTNQQDRQQTMPVPLHTPQPVESASEAQNQHTSGSQEQSSTGEVPPFVSLALSTSGLGQISNASGGASTAFHSAISPSQLAQFQMLIARQMSLCQGLETAAVGVQHSVEKQEDETEAKYDP